MVLLSECHRRASLVAARSSNKVSLKVEDVAQHGYAIDRASVRQRKSGRPVKFEITEQSRQAVDACLTSIGKKPGDLQGPAKQVPRCRLKQTLAPANFLVLRQSAGSLPADRAAHSRGPKRSRCSCRPRSP